jgi:hypothetical protein
MLVLAAVSACQSKSDAGARQTAARPPAIELKDAKGQLIARVTPGHPCRAMVDEVELLVGTDPLVAQLGEVRWTGTTAANGITIKRNDEVIARVFPVDQRSETGLYTPDGVAMFRATISGDKADLISGAGAVIGSVKKLPTGGISIYSPQRDALLRGPAEPGLANGERVLTGTNDLLLAALLGATEAPPEVRGLAACHRLLPSPNGL